VRLVERVDVDDPVLAASRPLLRAFGPLLAFARPAPVVAVGLLVGALVPLAWLTNGPSFCPFKVLTGLPCPGCGLTRATVALLHGDFATSFHFHPLALPMVAVMLVMALLDVWLWWRTHRSGEVHRAGGVMDRVARTPAPWIAIGALALVWLVRLPLYVTGVWTF
jgi:hypothetical protein